MSKKSALLVLIFHIFVRKSHSSLPEDIANASAECLTNSLETYLHCRGSRFINNIINNLSKTNKPIVIVSGFEIVPTNRHNNDTANNNGNINYEQPGDGGDDTDDDSRTFIGRFSRYLRTHELNIKFSHLMSSDESERYLARDSEQNGMQINLLDEARKKDKGNTMIMALGLILSKIMAVMGLGGIGALAMKALGVALTALMMATLIGIKSVAHQGNESSHSVQYVTADGHHHIRRRRRSAGNQSTSSKSQTILSKENDFKIKSSARHQKGW